MRSVSRRWAFASLFGACVLFLQLALLADTTVPEARVVIVTLAVFTALLTLFAVACWIAAIS